MPFALRRLGVARAVLPALTGRIRVLASDRDPLDRLEHWAEALAAQAGEGVARLRLLERYAAQADGQLEGARRPAALRRLVEAALDPWTV